MTDKELKTVKKIRYGTMLMCFELVLIQLRINMVSLFLGLSSLDMQIFYINNIRMKFEAEYNRLKGSRYGKSMKEISLEKCGFYLPECAYYDFINDAPDDANKAIIVKEAMEAIEDENPRMEGVLPKEVYAQLVPEEEPELLSNIVRIFKDIPENSTVDIFGEIYEYFLGNFALAEGRMEEHSTHLQLL